LADAYLLGVCGDTSEKALSAARVLVNLPGQFTNLATSASFSKRQVKVRNR